MTGILEVVELRSLADLAILRGAAITEGRDLIVLKKVVPLDFDHYTLMGQAVGRVLRCQYRPAQHIEQNYELLCAWIQADPISRRRKILLAGFVGMFARRKQDMAIFDPSGWRWVRGLQPPLK